MGKLIYFSTVKLLLVFILLISIFRNYGPAGGAFVKRCDPDMDVNQEKMLFPPIHPKILELLWQPLVSLLLL